MPDIRERFSVLDLVEIPDLRPDIERRGHAGPSFATRRTPSVTRRLLVACVALTLAIASFLLLTEAFRHTKNTVGHPSPPVVTPVVTNGEIWVRVGGGDGPSFVYRVDPTSGRSTALFHDMQTVPGTLPGSLSHIAVGEGYAWSPDGSRLAFSDYSGHGSEIFLLSPDGTSRTRLTRDGGLDAFPSWSPDGRLIAYGSDTTPPTSSGSKGYYTPGCEISLSLCPQQIKVIDAGGTGARQLTHVAGGATEPTWSPYGTSIAFVGLGVGGNQHLFVMDANGTSLRQLTWGASFVDSRPQYSPDGTRIAFIRQRLDVPGGSAELMVMNADGSNLHMLPGGDVTNFAWSPDGEQIAFDSTTQQGTLSMMSTDGSGLRQIVVAKGYGLGDIAWRPVPKTAATIPPSAPPSASPARLRVTGTLALPETAFGIATDQGAMWLAAYGHAIAVDPSRMTVTANIPVAHLDDQDGIAASAGTAWVTVGSRRKVVAIDEATNRIRATVPIPGIAGVSALTFGDGSLWASANNALLRIDPATGNMVATIPVFGDRLAVDGHLVWAMVSRHRPSVVAVDARTNQVAGRLLHVGRRPSWLGAAAGSGFLLDLNAANLVRIGAPTSTVPAP